MRVVIAHDPSSSTPSEATIKSLRGDVLGLGLDCRSEDCVGLCDLLARLMKGPADLLLVVLGDQPSTALAAIREVSRWRLPIIAVDHSADTERLLQTMRGGMREYLNADRFRDELSTAIESLREGGELSYERGRATAVISASAGSGVTTVAMGLAFALTARKGAGSDGVVLAELGQGTPDLALSLDLTPPYPLAQLLNQSARADSLLLHQALVSHEAGVSVLAHPPEMIRSTPVEPAAIRNLVVLFKAMFPETILDLGHTSDDAVLEALRLADSTVLVSRLDVPSLRRTRSYLRFLDSKGIESGSVVLTANRRGQRWRLANEAVGRPFDAWLPDDPLAINNALNQGRPLTRGSKFSAIARRMRRLTDRVTPAPERRGNSR